MARKLTALVTGASSGMGKVIAKQLLKDGYEVLAAARRVDKMDDLKALGAHVLELDVSKEESITQAFAAIEARFGGVDILVNNAGFGLFGAIEDVPLDEARYQFEVNMFGLARMTQLVLPHMRAEKAGKIVNMSSMGGRIYTPLGGWYHATKHAVEGFSDCLRLELAPFGIDVIVIEPGIIQTEFGGVAGASMQAFSDKGAYRGLVDRVVAATARSYANGGSSPAQMVADTVSRALATRRPRTRYVVGKLARPLISARAWLGDRLYDRLIMSAVR